MILKHFYTNFHYLWTGVFFAKPQNLKHMYSLRITALVITSLLFACSASNPSEPPVNGPTQTLSKQFKDYWYDGNAEIASYQLTQSRYGEQRKGSAVWVFVTEDFSAKKQVKLDNPQAAGKDKVSVLKLNALRKFVTGIYDYAIMQSVFTPIEVKQYPMSLKTTFSSQDWCGQSFMQLNYRDKGYEVKQFSYFESEGDEKITLPATLLEDEIPNRIRFNPAELPTGQISLIPSAVYARLQHKSIEPQQATVSLEDFSETESLYTIQYDNIDRVVQFRFEKAFPNYITWWREKDGNQPETIATLLKHDRLPYWGLHDNDDLYLRDSIGMGL